MDSLALSSAALRTTPLIPISTSSWKPQQRVFTISCKTPSLEIKSNFYTVLSISSPETTGAEDIKRAYRSMALRYHPDVCQDPSMKEESTRMFVLLHEAYMTLSDPVLRSEYDIELGLSCCDFLRSLWRDQLFELIKLNGHSKGRKEGSWGSRMREHNQNTKS